MKHIVFCKLHAIVLVVVLFGGIILPTVYSGNIIVKNKENFNWMFNPCQPRYDIIKFNIFFANALHPDHEGVCEKNVKRANFVNTDV